MPLYRRPRRPRSTSWLQRPQGTQANRKETNRNKSPSVRQNYHPLLPVRICQAWLSPEFPLSLSRGEWLSSYKQGPLLRFVAENRSGRRGPALERTDPGWSTTLEPLSDNGAPSLTPVPSKTSLALETKGKVARRGSRSRPTGHTDSLLATRAKGGASITVGRMDQAVEPTRNLSGLTEKFVTGSEWVF